MKRSAAFALPIVLWAVAILAAALVTTAVFLDLSMQAQLSSAKAAGARQLALSGIAFASAAKTPNLPYSATRKIDGEGSFSVIHSSDSGRINLNALLKKKDFDIISQLLVAWGSDPNKAALAVKVLKRRAWLQIDDSDPSTAGFIPFESFVQLQNIPEFAAAIEKKPDWRDQVTLWGTGTVDVNYASADVLMALAGLSSSQADTLIKTQAGKDGVSGTKDDVNFSSMETVVTLLGLSNDSAVRMRSYFGTKTEMDRITAIGDIGGMQRKVQVILKKDKDSGTPVAWDEE